MKTKFIINPIAGTGKQIGIENSILNIVDKTIFDYDIEYTKSPNHATEITKNAVKNNYELIISVGGDGTASECAKELIGSKTGLAVIPSGSGNGFAYHFGVKRKINEALKQLHSNKFILIDSCKINNQKFINVSGLGFDAHIANLFASNKKRGFLSYIKLTLQELFYSAQEYEIEYENISRKIKAFAIVFANASQYGNDARISPLSKVDDGLIDFVIINKFPNWKIPFFLIDVLRGKTHLNKNVEIIRSKKMLIKSDKPMVHLDGEVKNLKNPINVEIEEKNLKLFIPNEEKEK